MTKYAKIKNNLLEYAPTNKGSVSNWINDIQAVLADGYLPVELQDIPEGKYQVGYEVINNIIVRKLEEIPEPAPLTYEEVDALRIAYRKAKIDDKTIARMRKQANKTWTEEDEVKYLALDAEVTAYIEENYPYPEEKEASLLNKEEEIKEIVEEITQKSTIL